jgi:hypothetical protein
VGLHPPTASGAQAGQMAVCGKWASIGGLASTRSAASSQDQRAATAIKKRKEGWREGTVC